MGIISINILKKYKEGDHKAFDQIFLFYYNRVKNFINGLVKIEAEAEELTQDIFVKLWENRKNIDLDKPFNAYLFTIARNITYNYLKHQLVHKSYVNDYLSTNNDIDNQTEEIFFAKEINLLIEMTVEKMPSRRRDIFVCSRVKGLSNSEIAEKLNISKKTVENQLSLALKEIRDVVYFLIALLSGFLL